MLKQNFYEELRTDTAEIPRPAATPPEIPASYIHPLALRAFPPGREKTLDVREIRLIAGIFSPSRGDAAERQRGVAPIEKSSSGRCPKGRGVWQ